MERYRFLELYIKLARVVAVVVAIVGVLYALNAWHFAGFWSFVLTLFVTLMWAFFVLVGADLLACFKDIEQNTRRSGPS